MDSPKPSEPQGGKQTLELQLPSGQVALIDAEDYEKISQLKWSAYKQYRTYYAQACVNGSSITMHRVILGAKKGQIVDHKNHNGLDNRKENLRFCTLGQNTYNTRPRGRRKYKGAFWHKRDKVWRSQICFNGKRYWLGNHKDEISAATAYDAKAKEFFGEFALLNFPSAQ